MPMCPHSGTAANPAPVTIYCLLIWKDADIDWRPGQRRFSAFRIFELAMSLFSSYIDIDRIPSKSAAVMIANVDPPTPVFDPPPRPGPVHVLGDSPLLQRNGTLTTITFYDEGCSPPPPPSFSSAANSGLVLSEVPGLVQRQPQSVLSGLARISANCSTDSGRVLSPPPGFRSTKQLQDSPMINETNV